ncbi:antibiotic biosynthesis monooxygenase [Mycoplasmopsis alligatoris]|uniref:Antibiotic biosynthesis monooxygenase n=1 Tax=Mycoplasmopsis alligatoris A21JP2 TaxID=747682 RepID=D4XWV7_9BACT|nr:antibiotic biosynthesis monooxygenase [Mycoplasmopsis alligatoris]EFF41293.1 antibiotic biosynthesis monooxygenase [Mycoplasmopsis alligatoris A21JP2]
MIFLRATKYELNPEKMKGFVDYLYIFVSKSRLETQNLSFEFGLNSESEVILVERWSSKSDYQAFIKKDEVKKELNVLEKMAYKTTELYAFDTIR